METLMRQPKRGLFGRVKRLPCQACGAGWMKRGAVSSGNAAGICLALLLFAAGIIVFVVLPVIGWVIGPCICLFSLFVGGKTQNVWRCTTCGAIIGNGSV